MSEPGSLCESRPHAGISLKLASVALPNSMFVFYLEFFSRPAESVPANTARSRPVEKISKLAFSLAEVVATIHCGPGDIL